MTEKIFNIIMACKGQFAATKPVIKKNPNDFSPLERVKVYLSVACGTPIEHYTEYVMNSIMFDTMCDYLRTCDNAGEFIRSLKEIKDVTAGTEGERIAAALELVQVKQNGKYINGFGEYLHDTLIDEASGRRYVSEFVTNTAEMLNNIKDYEVGYGTPANGKMIVHFKDANYLVEVQALDHNNIETAMKAYSHLFKVRHTGEVD